MRSRAANIAAVTTAVVTTASVPACLTIIGVWKPRPPSLAATRQWIHQPMTSDFVIALAYVGAGALWLLLATAVLTHAYTWLARRHWLPALRLPGPLQGLTAAILGATAVTTTAAATPAHAAAAAGAAHDAEHETARTSTTAAAPHTTASQNSTLLAAGQPYTHIVRRGDTLSKIAAERLGDPDRWPEIFALNRGTHFTQAGGTLRNPNIIYPGWNLTLPDDATAPAAPPRRPAPPPAAPDKPAPAPVPTADPSPPAPTPATTGATTPTPAEPTHTPTTGNHGTCAPTSSTTTGSDTAATGRPGPRTGAHTPGMSLPTGSWVNLGLALAIAAAVALLWAHRQRRYTPGEPLTPARRGPDMPAPLPRVVGQIQRALRRARDGRSAHRHRASPDTDDADLANGNSQREAAGDSSVTVAHPAAPSTHSGDLGQAAPALAGSLPVKWPPAGLGLTGAGTHAAARGFLTAALAADVDEHPDARTQVVIPAATAAALLGAAAGLPRTPRLRIATGLNDAVDILEALTLHRARLVDQHEVATVADLRADAFEEPLPPVMLLADAPNHDERARVAALLTQSQRLDIHGVLLGAWPDGTTVTVDEEGTTTPIDSTTAGHRADPADVGRLSVLNPAEALDLLATLAEAHAGEAPALAPIAPETTPGQYLAPTQPDQPTPLAGAARAGAQAVDPPTRSGESRMQDADTSPTEVDEAPIASTASASSPVRAGVVEPAAGIPGPVGVRVLGAPGIAGGDRGRTLRAKSLELLVYLAVRDGSAPTEAILDDLLPDAPARKALHRLHTYVSDLRSVLRHHGGPGTYLTHPHHRYELNPDRLDIDLWRMRTAIRAAHAATSNVERLAALRRAVDTYRAPLADGCGYEWIDPYREAVRREALDAVIALTEELDGQPSEQLTVLTAAIPHHPYAEALYQAAMRARAYLRDVDGVRALRRTVTRQLAEIDVEPSDETLTLAHRLITDLHPSPGARRPPAPKGARS
ncbi:BTAD domain-containing putative transcriptional regulator [Micromonospora sp. NPDC005305]|uniref:BTAD domain-containing putative transcriptional regulator n=1 Tax=Micromonospora sp. NPDC005305 TaxID=3156875 RepID=UPI0033B309B3